MKKNMFFVCLSFILVSISVEAQSVSPDEVNFIVVKSQKVEGAYDTMFLPPPKVEIEINEMIFNFKEASSEPPESEDFFIFDLTGKLIMQGIELDKNLLAPGIYIYSSGYKKEKIIVLK